MTSLGVLWGIFLLVILLAAGKGMQNGIMRGFSGMASNSMFMWTQTTSKSYKGRLKLGEETDTMDTEGKVVSKMSIPKIDSKYIDDVLKEFIGEFSHLPPMFSAKKINGTRLYKLARQNKTVDRKIITTNISNVKFRSFERDRISFEVSCSKGTYIRVLGNEIAKKLGTVGYLDQLTRIAVGDHKISESISINEFENQWKSINS